MRNQHAMVAIAATWVLSACSSMGIRVPVTRPAEINLRGKSELIVGNIAGPRGGELASGLKDAVVGSGRFKLVDRTHLDQVLNELKLSVDDLADPASRGKLGHLMTGSVLVIGNVNRNQYSEKTRQNSGRCTRTEDGKTYEYTCTTFTRSGKADVMVSFDVIDVQTGENLKPKRLTCERKRETEAVDAEPQEIDGTALLDDCSQEVIGSFMKAIAPWQDYVMANFERDGDLPQLERGILYAQQGQWQEATQQFKEAIKISEGNGEISRDTAAKAHWDLGLALEFTSEFGEAEREVKRAFEISQNGDYLAEVANIKRLQAERRKLEEQVALDAPVVDGT